MIYTFVAHFKHLRSRWSFGERKLKGSWLLWFLLFSSTIPNWDFCEEKFYTTCLLFYKLCNLEWLFESQNVILLWIFRFYAIVKELKHQFQQWNENDWDKVLEADGPLSSITTRSLHPLALHLLVWKVFALRTQGLVEKTKRYFRVTDWFLTLFFITVD